MYRLLIMLIVFISSVVPSYHDRAYALVCPDPPQQVKKEWEAQVNIDVLKIGPVKGADLQTKIKNTTNDLLAKLPDAAWVYLEQMMYSAYCSAIGDDKTITDSKKRQLINEYNSVVRRTIDAKLNPQQKAQAEAIRQLSDLSKKATAEIKEKLSDIKKKMKIAWMLLLLIHIKNLKS